MAINIQNIKMKKIVKLIIFLLSVIIVLIYSRVFYAQKETLTLEYLPRFVTKDINGRIISKNSLENKATYLQFVNSIDPDDIDTLDSVYNNWKGVKLSILIIAKDNKFMNGKDYSQATIILRDYDKMLKLFRSSERTGTYHVFDNKGNVIMQSYTRDSYENRIKYYLNKAVYNKVFKISDFIDTRKKTSEIGYFKQIDEIIRNSGNDYLIFSLHTKICGTCSGGEIIHILKQYYKNIQSNISIIEIVQPYYNDKEINMMRRELQIDFPIYIADGSLVERWNELITEYTERELNGIIFVTNKSGVILNIMYPGCNCAKSFFNDIARITAVRL